MYVFLIFINFVKFIKKISKINQKSEPKLSSPISAVNLSSPTLL